MKQLNPKTIEELEKLFELSPPGELREHLTCAYFGYVAGLPTDALPLNFKAVSESVYFMLSFLAKAEQGCE